MNKKDVIPSLDTVQEHNIGKGEYKLPVTPDSEYIVDDSSFVPMKEAVKQLALNPNLQGANNQSMFDFPDGKDSGIAIPINRTKDGKDIAELSTSIADEQDHINSELKKQQEFEDFKKQTQERMNSQKSDTIGNF